MQQLTFDCRSLRHSQQRPIKKPHAASGRWRSSLRLANSFCPLAFAMESGQSPASTYWKLKSSRTKHKNLERVQEHVKGANFYFPRPVQVKSLM